MDLGRGDSHTILSRVPNLHTIPGVKRFNVLEFELGFGITKVLRNSTFS